MACHFIIQKESIKLIRVEGQIQMIFQDPYSSLNPRFKVKDIIAEPIKFFQKSITRIDLEQNVNDLIDIVGMTRNGAICETNETEKLFNEPDHQYTKQLINLMPKIESLI
jgi:ABC-type microcin C transport system duplicated ATPase subunit YejF